MSRMVTVRFTRDFAPYKAGDTRKVRADVGQKLHDEYHVADVIEGGNIMVRVVKSLVSKLGPEWHPNSVHLADINLIRPYIDGGFVVIDQNAMNDNPQYTFANTQDSMDDDDDDTPRTAPNARKYPKPDPDPTWYKSHDWSGVSVAVAVRTIALAAQSGESAAVKMLNQWVSDGHMHINDGRVEW